MYKFNNLTRKFSHIARLSARQNSMAIRARLNRDYNQALGEKIKITANSIRFGGFTIFGKVTLWEFVIVTLLRHVIIMITLKVRKCVKFAIYYGVKTYFWQIRAVKLRRFTLSVTFENNKLTCTSNLGLKKHPKASFKID